MPTPRQRTSAILLGAMPIALAIAALLTPSPVPVIALALLVSGVSVWVLAREWRDSAEARRRTTHARRAVREIRALNDLDAQRRARRLSQILDRIDVPILVVGDDGVIELANASASGLVGRTGSKVVGRTLDEQFSQSALHRCFEEALTGRSARARLSLGVVGARRTFDAVGVALFEGERRRVVLTLADVTDLANSMRLKTDFVANASHELRTPLAAIRGAVETLEEMGEGESMRTRLVGIIAKNAARLEDLLGDLLELSRLESGRVPERRDTFDVREMFEEIALSFARICEQRSLRLALDVQTGLERLATNRRLLEVSLSNYIDNATRFSREDRSIVVRVLAADRPDLNPRARVRFEVADEGQGIPVADQTRIFERFYQVDPARSPGGNRGTGLGLAIVKHAVHLLGGSVGVESVLARGSTFWLEIPRLDPDAISPQSQDAASRTGDPGHQRDQSIGATSTPKS